MGVENLQNFIAEVGKRDILWNPESPNYKNVLFKTKAWEEIGNEFGWTVDDCKRKWKCLRSAYSRALNKANKSGHTSDDSDSNWKYTSQLEFLRGHVKCRRRFDGIEMPDVMNNTTDSLPEHVFPQQYLKEEITEEHSDSDTSPVNRRKRRKTGKQSIKKGLMDTIDSLNQYLKQPRSSGDFIFDEDELFFQSLLLKLKRFPMKEKNQLKLQILQMANRVEEEVLFNQDLNNN